MIPILRAMAALALIVPTASGAKPPATRTAKPSKPARVAPPPVTPPLAAAQDAPVLLPSAAVMRVARWVGASNDHHSLPWAVIDKTQAALFLFDGKGKPLAAVPVLIGIAPGDDASPDVGNKTLADLGPAEKTTPAGRFLARFGLPVGGERVLWVDYATSVAIHTIPATAGAAEKRRERMLSPTPDDNRITFGCINVPRAFYGGVLRPLFRRKGGYVYVLPDSKPIESVFPRLRVQTVADGGTL